MSSFDYGRSASTATRLITRFGQMGAVRRITPGNGPDYDPGPGTPTDYPARFVITEYDNREIDGTRIQATDRKAMVSPDLEIEPKTTDLLIGSDGRKLTIVSISPIKPAETVIVWQLQVRG